LVGRHITANDIPKNYGISDMIEYTKKAIESYNKGNIIEAFVVLHSILEMDLTIVWNTFVTSIVKTNPRPAPKPKDYLDLVDLLCEFELLNEKQCSIFYDFHKGRNEAVHHLASHMKRKVGSSKMDARFKSGIKATEIIDQVSLKLFRESFPMSLLSKNETTDPVLNTKRKTVRDPAN